ncbi:MAG TPA: hypothetical protein VFU04_08520, partial [Solirubrobacterales bacterium]|nr:hypothetical protein [Solirubrobacterales bacterium]
MTAELPDRVRAACACVAARARSVRIDEGAIGTYAETLPAAVELPAGQPGGDEAEGSPAGD